jgi:predicted enzyme related to lactoylglutathione lyase
MKRFHVHVAVEDLDKTSKFYSGVFGSPPTVLKPDYAKWMVDDPRINFAISKGAGGNRSPRGSRSTRTPN